MIAGADTLEKRTHMPYAVSVEEYVRFQRDGYLVVKGW